MIDIVFACVALLLATPLMAVITVAILICDGRPVLFCQRRAGRNGTPFSMLKFRTMWVDAEARGGSLTLKNDRRIMPIGRLLRQSKLDELPQLINVVRGEMTVIGPRPEVLDWVERFTPEQRKVLEAKPGLSDPVQLLFRHEQEFLSSAAEYERLVSIKIRRQIDYLKSRTFVSDVGVVLMTLRALFPSRPSAEELAIYSSIRQDADTRAS